MPARMTSDRVESSYGVNWEKPTIILEDNGQTVQKLEQEYDSAELDMAEYRIDDTELIRIEEEFKYSADDDDDDPLWSLIYQYLNQLNSSNTQIRRNAILNLFMIAVQCNNGYGGSQASEIINRVVSILIEHIANEGSFDNRDLIERCVGIIGTAQDVELVGYIRTALESNDLKDIYDAIHYLKGLGDKRATGALIVLLGHNDYNVRKNACYALGAIGDPRAVDALINVLLNDTLMNVRGAAAEALGYIGHPRAVNALITALGDMSAFVREHAALALGRIGHPIAVNALIQLMVNDNYASVRQACAEALGMIGSPAAIDALIQVLNGNDEASVRAAAARSLGMIGGEEVIPHLINALMDPNSGVRFAAMEGLVFVGSAAIDDLIAALGHSNGYVRVYSAMALGEIGDPSAIPALIALMDDDNYEIRKAAGIAISKMGETGFATLISALSNSNWKVRQAVAIALGTLNDPRAVQPLIQVLLNDNDHRVRSVAERAITKILGGFNMSTLAPYLMDRMTYRRIEEFLNQKQQLCSNMLTSFNVTVNPAHFTLEELIRIRDVLNMIPLNLINQGLLIRSFNGSGHIGGMYLNNTISIKNDMELEGWFTRALIHELGHFIDDMNCNFRAFQQLYAQSQYPEDYAKAYGQTNYLEDFATCIEFYMLDSISQFLRGITQAQNGKPVYLKKMLYILNLLSEGTNTSYLYLQEDGRMKRISVSLTRDSNGEITHINGVSINNLQGLYDMFSNLSFGNTYHRFHKTD